VHAVDAKFRISGWGLLIMRGRLRGDQPGLRDDSAFALPEMLVAIMIGLTVAATAGMVLITVVRSQPAITERAGQVQQGRTMVETIGRELRQGESLLAASASGLTLLTYVPTTACGVGTTGAARLCRVTYTCGSQSCTRTERNPDGTGNAPARQVVRGISGPAVFTFQPTASIDAQFVGIQLVFPQEDGQEAVTVSDGVALRNHADATGA
jgi:hypothetical protein